MRIRGRIDNMIEIENGIIGITKDNKMIVFESEQEFTDYDKVSVLLEVADLEQLKDGV